jgi:hypothetical protein
MVAIAGSSTRRAVWRALVKNPLTSTRETARSQNAANVAAAS